MKFVFNSRYEIFYEPTKWELKLFIEIQALDHVLRYQMLSIMNESAGCKKKRNLIEQKIIQSNLITILSRY